jgi:hypothetical protein
MTSAQVKQMLIGRFTFANGFVGAVTEAPNLNSADVLAVRFGGKIQEYEIKVSRADLVGEMRAARVAAGLDDIRSYAEKSVQLALTDDGLERTETQVQAIYEAGHSLSKTKLDKPYLSGAGREPKSFYGFPSRRQFVPSNFYWCIPMELLETCRELNKGLPYGIYVWDAPPTKQYYPPKCVVKASRDLKGQGDKVFFELFNRACTQWQGARGEIARLEHHIAELEAKLYNAAAG